MNSEALCKDVQCMTNNHLAVVTWIGEDLNLRPLDRPFSDLHQTKYKFQLRLRVHGPDFYTDSQKIKTIAYCYSSTTVKKCKKISKLGGQLPNHSVFTFYRLSEKNHYCCSFSIAEKCKKNQKIGRDNHLTIPCNTTCRSILMPVYTFCFP